MRFIPKIDIMSLLRWCHNKNYPCHYYYFTVEKRHFIMGNDYDDLYTFCMHSSFKKAAKFIASIIYFISLSVVCQF